jgi:hypothetical protein
MTSIIKVDQIQTAAGGTPTAADLGLNVTGSVLQVQRHSFTNQTSIGSTSYVSVSGSSFTFTPKASSSTLIIVSDVSCRVNGTSQGMMYKHYVAGSSISNDVGYGHETYFNTSTSVDIYLRQTKSDSYSNTSTSPKTIELYARDYNTGGDQKVNFGGRFMSSTIVYEIAG